MNLIRTSLCFIFAVSTTMAALRVRYSTPITFGLNHEARHSDTAYWAKIEPGAWDGYDPVSGFDNVDINNFGSLENAPYVTATYWMDSLYEEFSAGGGSFARTLESGYLVKQDDPNYTVQSGGFIVLMYGQLKIPSTGEFTFWTGGDDTGFKVWIDLNGDGTFTDNEAIHDLKNPSYSLNGALKPLNLANSDKVFIDGFTRTVSLQAGAYKIRAWKWNHSGAGFAGLFWKKPGSSQVEQIPASAFGKKRQLTPAVAIFKSILFGSAPQDLGFLVVPACQEVTMTAEANNMLGYPASKFKWNFGDASPKVITEGNTVKYTYPKVPAIGPFLNPTVQVERNGIWSNPSPPVALIQVSDCTETGIKLAGSGSFQSWELNADGSSLLIPTAANKNYRVEAMGISGQRIAWLQAGSADAGSTRFSFKSSSQIQHGLYFLRVWEGSSVVGTIKVPMVK